MQESGTPVLVKEEDEEVVETKTLRDNLYSRIDVSVKTMDKVIVGLLLAIVISVICGIAF